MIETLHDVHYGFMDNFPSPAQILSASQSILPATMMIRMLLVGIVSCIKWLRGQIYDHN